MASLLLTDAPATHVRLITLNRPERRNAMTAELCSALHAELDAIAADRSCRVVVITGAPPAFCVGLDLGGYGSSPGADGSDEARDQLANQEHMSRLILKVRATPQPVIAAVNGAAAGFGLALSLASDIRYAVPEAVFRAVFLNVGVSNCDMGTSWLLPRLVGAARAHELMLTGRTYGAEEGQTYGLSHLLVDDGKGLATGMELAERVATNAPMSNFAIMHALPRIAETDPGSGLFAESLMASVASSTDEAKARLRDFLEKRGKKVLRG